MEDRLNESAETLLGTDDYELPMSVNIEEDSAKALDPRGLKYQVLGLKNYLLNNVPSANIPTVMELVKSDFELRDLFGHSEELPQESPVVRKMENLICTSVYNLLKKVSPFLKGSGSVEAHVAHGILMSILALATEPDDLTTGTSLSNREIAAKFDVNRAYLGDCVYVHKHDYAVMQNIVNVCG